MRKWDSVVYLYSSHVARGQLYGVVPQCRVDIATPPHFIPSHQIEDHIIVQDSPIET